MKTKNDRKLFDTEFLNLEGPGRKIVHLKPNAAFFSQGAQSQFLFYLINGRAKLTVVSKAAKKATITLLVPGEFIGEEAIAGAGGLRMSTASAITAITAMKIVTR